MNIIWLGHSAFRIEIEDQVLLIDPWLSNPLFPKERRAEATAGVTQILITHAHGDHTGEALALSKELGIRVACIHELAEWLENEGASALGFGKGGTISLGRVKVTMVNAVHSSSIDSKGFPVAHAGSEAGFMIAGEGHTIYVSGDTDVTMDMGLWNELHAPDIGILCAGGHYTMDMKRAAFAAKRFFNFETVIPCHYRTFPLLEQSAEPLRQALSDVRVIEPEVLSPIAFASR